MSRVVTMATNFGTNIAINWLFNADIADILHLRDGAMATTFCLSMGYNFGCMIGCMYIRWGARSNTSNTLFDSRGGFSG